MFRVVSVAVYSLVFVSLFFLVFLGSDIFNWLLFFSMLFFLFGIFEIFDCFDITRKLSFKTLGSERFLVVGGVFPSFLSIYYTLVYGNFSFLVKEIIFLFGGVLVFLTSFLLLLFTFRGRKSKIRILSFSIFSFLLSYSIIHLLKENAFLLYSVITLIILVGFLIASFSKFSILKIDKFFVFVFIVLVGILDFVFVLLNSFREMIAYGVLVSSVILVLGVFSVLLRKIFAVVIFGILWGGGITLSTVLLKDVLPVWLLQANVLSIFSIIVSLFVYWYFDRYRPSFDLIMRDIDTFLKELNKVVPREFENYNEFIAKVFNSHSRFIKISILSQNFLPNFVLSKMLKKKSLSIGEIFNTDTETKNFFVSNGIMWISRISNEVSETDYLVIKFPRLVGNIYFQEMFEELVRSFLPIFVEIEKMVSNILVYPLRQEVEKKREYQVREVESFDKVRYFLIKTSDMFLYEDKIVAYKYVEDVDKMRGYYFDFVVKHDSFLGFLFFIPDRLFLSNFVLLAIKGIIKSYYVENLSFEKIREISKDFIKERDLPLQISITGLLIQNDGIIVYPSNSTFSYIFNNSFWKEIKSSEKVDKDSILLISTRALDEKIFNLVEQIPKDNKFDFVKNWFSKVEIYEDTFLLVCI